MPPGLETGYYNYVLSDHNSGIYRTELQLQA